MTLGYLSGPCDMPLPEEQGTRGHAHRRPVDRGRGWRDAATSSAPDPLAAAGGRKGPPLEPLAGARPC